MRTEDGVDYGDLPAYVDFPYLVRNIRVNLAAAASLAKAPASPKAVRIANARDLDNNTVLTWDPVPDAASYQILCRETDRAEWLPALPLGLSDKVPAGVTEFTCPLSKDNYYFAVRALSPDGHPGLPAVAR